VPREARQRTIDAALVRYVALLDRYCCAAPYNWFNYFDFWQGGRNAANAGVPASVSASARKPTAAPMRRRESHAHAELPVHEVTDA